ncbi:MAG: bacterial Ig-like domain-containing protein [Eubacteriaceae bacterium]|nr:bacterial Ig-like domain-containing protein [Eubacteriaceae bacterium]
MADGFITRHGGSAEVVVDIDIANEPTKTSYIAGETLDMQGLELDKLLTDGDDITGEEPFTTADYEEVFYYLIIEGEEYEYATGEKLYENTTAVRIRYKYYSADLPITVQRVLDSIGYISPPNKTSYKYGEALDMGGIVCNAIFTSDGMEYLYWNSTGLTFSPANGTAMTTPGTNSIDISYTENGVTRTFPDAFTVEVANAIYGAEWDGTASTKLSRTDAAAGFTDPVPYIAGAASYNSPFDSIQPWSGMVRSTDTEAGEVVAIPKFYYKWTATGDKLKLQVSMGPQTGFHVSPAHQDRGDGTGERDVVYVGRYHCASTYKSATGVNPVNNITRSAARASIHGLGTKVWQFDFAMIRTIQMLYLVEFADWNSQVVIGRGGGNGSNVEAMGVSDSMPYHTGTTLSDRYAEGVGVQYRHIEGLWENVKDFMDGCYYDNNGLNVIKDPASFSDTVGGALIGAPVTGITSAFSIPTAAGFDWAIYPSAGNGDGSSYTTDYWSSGNASSPVLISGCGCYPSGQSGLWASVDIAVTGKNDVYGCRLQKLP